MQCVPPKALTALQLRFARVPRHRCAGARRCRPLISARSSRPAALSLFTGVVSALAALLVEYALDVSDAVVAAVTGTVLAVFALITRAAVTGGRRTATGGDPAGTAPAVDSPATLRRGWPDHLLRDSSRPGTAGTGHGRRVDLADALCGRDPVVGPQVEFGDIGESRHQPTPSGERRQEQQQMRVFGFVLRHGCTSLG